MRADNPAGVPAWAVEDVRIVDPDPSWPKLAEVFAAEARALLQAWLAGPIVHVGSTAVPGLPAKPVIDLQASAYDPASAIAAAQAELAAASWFFVSRELDQRSWRWFVVRADPTAQHRLAHLHLMQPDEPRWDQQLAFRDRLRASPALAAEYARLKETAATQHPHDREAYAAEKSMFIQRVLDCSS